MIAKRLDNSSEAALWKRVIRFEGRLSPTAARALLQVKFSPSELERMAELAAKARTGTLTPEEERETDAYERLG